MSIDINKKIMYYIGMMIINDNDSILNLEQKITFSINLLEVAKSYCDFHYDKSQEFIALSSVLDVLLKNQRELAGKLDGIISL